MSRRIRSETGSQGSWHNLINPIRAYEHKGIFSLFLFSCTYPRARVSGLSGTTCARRQHGVPTCADEPSRRMARFRPQRLACAFFGPPAKRPERIEIAPAGAASAPSGDRPQEPIDPAVTALERRRRFRVIQGGNVR
jgi:hypothetical protein